MESNFETLHLHKTEKAITIPNFIRAEIREARGKFQQLISVYILLRGKFTPLRLSVNSRN